MGRKTIWDGEGMPEIGDDVLLHLASLDRWCVHQVTGFEVRRVEIEDEMIYPGWWIMVHLEVTGGGSVTQRNGRLLEDIRPLTFRGEDRT